MRPNRDPVAIPSTSVLILAPRTSSDLAGIGLDRRITSENGQRRRGWPIKYPRMHDRSITGKRPLLRPYHGWLVVAAAFLVALYGFGLGFYGPGIYLVALKELHGWPVDELSSAITTYYVLGATLLFFWVGPLFERHGARKMVVVGTVAMACGTMLLAHVTRPWHVYAAFAAMSAGWATMSGAAINIIVAPWFDKRRGLAVSWALNGASAGGIIIAPLLTFLITRFGFAVAIESVTASMLAVLMPVAVVVLRPKRDDEHDPVEGAPDAERSSIASPGEPSGFRLTTVLSSTAFISISVPFALGLTAQVGFLTHQIAFLAPSIGTVAAGWTVSMTTFAAVLGRIVTGYIADRFDRRVVACVNFIVQMLGMTILATARTPALLYIGCVLFGLGVGNTTSLPGLLVQQDFPKQHFARIVSLVVAINQFSFAFGPSLLGQLEHAEGNYSAGLLVCLSMEAVAAIIVISPAITRWKAGRFTG
jgi:MFS family permease